MKSTWQPPKPPVGLSTARKQALTLDEVANPYVRRRLESIRFSLDAAVPWVEAAVIEARDKDKLWLLAVASQLGATSQRVSELLRDKAFNLADWTRQTSQVLAAIDTMLSLYAEAAEDVYWGYFDVEPGQAKVA